MRKDCVHPITYLKISTVFLEASLTQLFSWIESAFVTRRTIKQSNLSVQEFQNCRGDIYDARFSGRMNPTPTVSKRSEPNLIKLCLKIFRWICRSICFIYRYNKSSIENCQHLFHNHLIPDKIKEIAILGISDEAKIVLILARQTGIRIAGIYDNVEGFRFSGHKVSHYMNLKDYQGKVLISSAINIEEKTEKLKSLGIKEENILKWRKFL